MRNMRKTYIIVGAFALGGLLGYVMWLLTSESPPARPEPEVTAVTPTGEPADEPDERDGPGPPAVGAAPPEAQAEPAQEEPVEEEPPPAPDPSWRVPGAPFRQIVEIALVPARPEGGGAGDLPHDPIRPPAVARCDLALGEVPPGQRRARVFDSEGREVRSRLVVRSDGVWHGGEGGADHDLYFEAKTTAPGDRFEVYYPAPGGGDVPALEGGPQPDGDLMVTVYEARVVGPSPRRSGSRRAGGKHVRNLPQIVKAIGDNKALGAPRRRTHIDDRESPYGPGNHYAAVYQSYLSCPRSGEYHFGIDADDLAVLLVDGKEVLKGGRPGHLPDRPFPYRTRRNLKAGLHTIVLYHIQSTELLRARLAWQPPGASGMRVIPPSAFVSHVQARPVALEARDELPGIQSGAGGAGRKRPGPQAFFRAEPGRRLVVNGSVPVTQWRLVAAALPDDLPGARWVWREGGADLGEGPELGIYVSGLDDPACGIRPYRDVTLVLESGPAAGPVDPTPGLPDESGEAGHAAQPVERETEKEAAKEAERRAHSSYKRRIHALETPPVEAEGLTLRLEPTSAPNFIHPHEDLKLVLRAINDSREAVSLEATELSWAGDSSGDSPGARSLGEFELPQVGTQGADVLARRMNVIALDFAPEAYARLDRLVYLLGPPRAPAVKLVVDLLPSREHVLPGLRVEADRFLTDSDARAIFVLPYDRESDRRRFAILRRLTESGGDSRKALLYGDELASPGARGGGGLLPRMRAQFGDRVKVRAVALPEGGYPIDAAVAAIDNALLEQSWGRIWLSVGTLDARAGTPVREFTRGLDAMIDRVRTLRSGARLVIVGPPPEWSREDVSRRYAVAAREVAEQHHVALAELHDLVEGLVRESAERGDPPSFPWRETEDGVHFPYPLGAAMDEIAREVLRR